MNEDRIGYQEERYLPNIRPYITSGAIEIATLCQGVVAGRIEGVTLPACSLVSRAGPIFGIRFEPTLFDGEISRIARMRDRTHLSADNLIPDFGRFRTNLEIFAHFLAGREVVTFGLGYYRVWLLREAVSNIADLFVRTDGVKNPSQRIAQLTSDPTIRVGRAVVVREESLSDLGKIRLEDSP